MHRSWVGVHSAPSPNSGLSLATFLPLPSRPVGFTSRHVSSRHVTSVSRFDHPGRTTTVNNGVSRRPDHWTALYVGLLVPSSRRSRRSGFCRGLGCSRGSRFSLDQGSGAKRTGPVSNLETAVAERDVASVTCSRASLRFTLDEGCGPHPSCTCDQMSTRRQPPPLITLWTRGVPRTRLPPSRCWNVT